MDRFSGDKINPGMRVAVPGLPVSFAVVAVRPVSTGHDVELSTGAVLHLDRDQKAWVLV